MPIRVSKISLLILITFTIHAAFGQKLTGKVKSYKDTYYSLHEVYGKLKKGPKLNDTIFHDQLVIFDPNGNVSQSVEYNADGTVNSKYQAQRDLQDNNMESVYVRFDPELIIEKKPFIIESVKYPSGEICAMGYKTDNLGNPMEETLYDLMGQLILSVKIYRNADGKPTEYKYSNGNTDSYKYDNLGNKTQWVSVTSTGNTTKTNYSYDAHGNIEVEEIDNFFKSSYNFHIEHNTFSYKYDKFGNWTERIDYEHDIPQRIIVRTIEYSEATADLMP